MRMAEGPLVIQKPDQTARSKCRRKDSRTASMGCCSPKSDPLSMLGIAQSSADPPFFQTFNAIAKKGNAMAKNGETTCMGNRKKDS
jgi:hypothetical protein